MPKWKEEARPAKSPRQCDRCIWRDGVDSSVNEVCQGLGLCSADSFGDVSVVQETYRERSTWLLVCRPAINHSNLLRWGVGKLGGEESGQIKSKGKMWSDPPSERRKLALYTALQTREDNGGMPLEMLGYIRADGLLLWWFHFFNDLTCHDFALCNLLAFNSLQLFFFLPPLWFTA